MEDREKYYIESENAVLKNIGVELHYTMTKRAGSAVNPHIHESVELLYFIEGEFIVISDQNRYNTGVGDLIMFRSNSLHRVYANTEAPGKYFVIKIKPSLLLELSDRDSGYAYVMRFVLHNEAKIMWTKQELEEIPTMLLAIKTLIGEHDSPCVGSEIIRKAAAASLLVSILRDDAAKGTAYVLDSSNITAVHQIYKAINYINENYGNDISALECAGKVNMSYSYFSRTFKAITGKLFRNYLTEVRIDHAEKLMIQSDLSITEIALECGFGDVSYFISRYKALRGITPHRFRKNI